MKKTCLGLVLLASSQLNANVGNDLNNFFDGLGFSSNVTNPGSYNSQAAGSYGGGSIFARNQVRSYQLIQIDLPDFRAGCGGIDLYMGSISFLSKDKMIALSKSIMTNAGFYAFDLALATTVPAIKDVKDKLQQIEQFVNNQNQESCRDAQALVGGMWPKTEAASDKICRDQGTMGSQGYFSDYVQARHGCAGDQRKDALKAAQANPKLEKRLAYDKNIVWSLLKSKSFLASDNELCELVMSLTGTIIFDKEGHAKPVPSLVSSRDLIQALIGREDGLVTKAKIWSCKDNGAADKCLNVYLKEIIIPETSTLRYKVNNLIKKTIELVKSKTPNEKDIKEVASFAAMTHLPILKFVTVLASSEYSESIVDLTEYSSVIAEDLLQQYLAELLQEISNVTVASEFNEDLIKEIKGRIKDANKEIAKLEPRLNTKLQQKMVLVQSIRMIEREVATQMSNEIG